MKCPSARHDDAWQTPAFTLDVHTYPQRTIYQPTNARTYTYVPSLTVVASRNTVDRYAMDDADVGKFGDGRIHGRPVSSHSIPRCQFSIWITCIACWLWTDRRGAQTGET